MERGLEVGLSKMASYRSNVYGVLGACFGCPPNQALLGWLRRDEIAAILAQLGLELQSVVDCENESALLKDLSAEYDRLYAPVGGHVPSSEAEIMADRQSSARRAAAVRQETGPSVSRAYKEAGFSPPHNFNGPIDQIGVQYEFMRLLTYRESVDWRKRKGADAIAIVNAERAFVTDHMSAWVPSFARLTKKNAELSLYPQMSELARRFVALDSDFLLNEAPTESALASAS